MVISIYLCFLTHSLYRQSNPKSNTQLYHEAWNSLIWQFFIPKCLCPCRGVPESIADITDNTSPCDTIIKFWATWFSVVCRAKTVSVLGNTDLLLGNSCSDTYFEKIMHSVRNTLDALISPISSVWQVLIVQCPYIFVDWVATELQVSTKVALFETINHLRQTNSESSLKSESYWTFSSPLRNSENMDLSWQLMLAHIDLVTSLPFDNSTWFLINNFN